MIGYTITKDLHSQLEKNRIKWFKHHKFFHNDYFEEYQLCKPDVYMVGAFHTYNTPSMGYVKNELARLSPSLLFLSVGRNGYLLERPITKSQIQRLKLKVV